MYISTSRHTQVKESGRAGNTETFKQWHLTSRTNAGYSTLKNTGLSNQLFDKRHMNSLCKKQPTFSSTTACTHSLY